MIKVLLRIACIFRMALVWLVSIISRWIRASIHKALCFNAKSCDISHLCDLSLKVSYLLTHWGRVMHICVSKLTIIGSDNGLSPGQRQAIIWTNAGLLLTRPLAELPRCLSNFRVFEQLQNSKLLAASFWETWQWDLLSLCEQRPTDMHFYEVRFF